MQEVKLYTATREDVVGTIVFAQTDVISSNVMDFTQNTWVVGKTILNNATGLEAIILSVVSSTNIQLSVTGFASGGLLFTIIQELIELDLFKDETISLTQSIKNTKDIAKIQTDFTQSFTLPASKTNNKIFKHFHRSDVLDGFDARFLKPAQIKLNGVDFKKGKLRLLGVEMKDNNPSSYKISFVGSTVSLKTAFGDDELTNLPYLDAYNHTYSYTNIRNYMEDGFNPTGDGTGTTTYPELVYPFISTSKNRYYYNTAETTNSQPHIPNVRNIFNDGTPASNDHQDYRAIQYFDLKPAIKVYNILKAIEEKYGFTISNDFFRTSTGAAGKPNVDGLFNKLYMFCNRKAGSLIDIIDESSAEVKFNELTFDTGTDVRQDNNTSFYIQTGFLLVERLTYEAYITTSGGGAYDVELYDVDTGEIYYTQENIQNPLYLLSFVFQADFNRYKTVKPSLRIKTKGGLSSFELTDVELTRESFTQTTSATTIGNYSKSSINLSNGVDFRNKLLPKIKVIDFMTNLFKMFNLIAYFEGNELVVKTLDQYYLNSGNQEFEIDKYIDSSSSKVNRTEVYSEINYEYKKANTIFAINSNEATNDEYGNERFKSEGLNVFDGKKYDVKSSFGHMLYENLVNPATVTLSGSVNSSNSNYIVSSGSNFNQNEWIVGATITNYVTGDTAIVERIMDNTSLYLSVNTFSVGDSFTISATNYFSGVTFGHTVSQSNSPVIDGGSLFVSTRKNLPTNIWVTDKVVGVNSSYPQELDILYVPANVYTGFGVGVRSINFGSEFDEFTNSEEQDSLFKTYHENFILNIYNPKTRILKITAHLPLSILLKYELNDRFIVRGEKYLINSIKTNLQTGKSELELLTDNYGT
jgi:hypothetical protein